MAKQVLVSGAGIAGLALAYCLGRFGFQVSVVERWAGIRRGGQPIDIRGAAKEAVWRMGLDEPINAARTKIAGMSFVTRNNRRIVTLRSDQFDGDGRIAGIEILRAELAAVFHAAAGDSTEYLFGERITSLDQDAGGVSVGLASGARRRFDLVIGADGLHSGVRSLVFGPESDYARHLGHYVAFFTVPNVLGLRRWVLSYQEPGRRAALRGGTDRDAVGLLGFRSPKLDYDYQDLAAHKALLRERFAGMAWYTPWLLDQLDTAPDFFFDSCAQIRMTSWSRGRVALVGDAAFCPSPLSGQGTSLAIVGAYVLAGELAAAGPDHAAAFSAYQNTLREFVNANQKLGENNAATQAPATRAGIIRQYLTSLANPCLPASLLNARHDLRAVNQLRLPDYTDLVTC